ncbi:MAG: hypothetical protein JWQ11_2893 [Rhizobacter sp.]|nr:hypothetical protein [Rhizobacter sp.]
MYRCDELDRTIDHARDRSRDPIRDRTRSKATATRAALLAAAISGLLPLVAATTAQAQTAATQQIARNFPQNALRGNIAVVSASEITLNGRPARLAPGSRIRNTDNMLEMSGTLIGREFVANYTMEDSGLVRDIWILRGDERARRPWPTSMEQARAWEFDMTAQTWTRP